MKFSCNISKLAALSTILAISGFLVYSSLKIDPHRQESNIFHYFDVDKPVPDTKILEDDWNPLVGYWKGTLGGDLRLIFRVTENAGEVYTYSLDQGGSFIPATGTNVRGGEVRFFFDTINGSYVGNLSADGKHLEGSWKQNGYALQLDYTLFEDEQSPRAVPKEIYFANEKSVTYEDYEKLATMEGFWSGVYKDEGPAQPVILHFEKLASDLIEPKLFLPMDSRLPMNIRNFVLFGSGDFKIVVEEGEDAMYVGKLEGKTMTGIVTEDDCDEPVPLTLTWSPENPNASFEHEMLDKKK